jgi:hypothetical protein
LCVLVLLSLSACIDWSVDPDEIVAIEFPEPPYPSVVAGDTLRDSTGAVAPLTATFFDGAGNPVPGTPVEFLTRDTTVRIVGDLVVGTPKNDGTARLIASGAGIQSIVRQIQVVPYSPRSLLAQGTVDTLRLSLLGTLEENTSGPISARVADSSGTNGIRSWIVSFTLQYHGVVVPAGDTTAVWLVNDAGRPSQVDTTDTQGIAARRVRYRVGTTVPPVDSAIVIARASYRGAPLAGSPVQRVLPIRPKS